MGRAHDGGLTGPTPPFVSAGTVGGKAVMSG